MTDGPPAEALRVLVVDDDEAIRRVIRRRLTADPRFTVVGEAGTGEEAIGLLDDVEPDVIVIDFEMPGADGLATAERILHLRPRQAMVLCSAVITAELRTAADDLGMRACLEKTELHLLTGTIRAATA